MTQLPLTKYYNFTLNITFKENSFGGGTSNIPKKRTNRGVRGLRPPPGGAHAADIITS